ncbi:hypothetical protein GON26_17825 [Flavobacterium sp. GA093]|uniref:Uncharacterized protein n=1 Tax=Flavobacterium hydrocarbonoxydans TaxID=2683249 RepID=A0A6I4NUQ1_9FLAO|nr:hypothetical protein [Flavobacterium hydrocarbonoxydans]MWB96225.1 hypothetical protein [Flavobacterium hydrocarbonoxydans]
MLDNLNKKYLYLSISISVALFIFLNFILGPTSVFGLAKFIQNKTGYFFGVDINTFDYLLISSIPICSLILTEKRKRKNLSEILKYNLIICLSCVLTFCIGLFILNSKIGSPSENPLFPEYLRVEPFKQYSLFFIILGLIFPFLFTRKEAEETKSEIELIGKQNE